MHNRAAIYVRLSREDEKKRGNSVSASIHNQTATISDYAFSKGFLIYKIYSDDGYSGACFDRPAFNELLRDARLKRYDVLLIKDISRLGRSLYRVGELIEEIFPAYGIRVISLGDGYDSAAYSDEISVVFKSFLSEYYLKEFKKKCRKAREHCAKTKHLNYYPKYGYIKDVSGKETIDSYSAEIVKKIYHCIAHQNMSCKEVAEALNKEGVITRSKYATKVLNLKPLHRTCAENWSSEMVWSIATDYEYCGHSVNLLRHSHEDRILLYNTHCRIISDELFECVQKKLRSRSKSKNKLDHFGHVIVDFKSGKNLLYSSKQQVYYLRINNKKKYHISSIALETVLLSEIKACYDECFEDYARNKIRKEKEYKTSVIDRLNIEHAQLIERKFQEKIDMQTYIKKSKAIMSAIGNIDLAEKNSFCIDKYLKIKKIFSVAVNDFSMRKKLLKRLICRVDIDYNPFEGFIIKIRKKSYKPEF